MAPPASTWARSTSPAYEVTRTETLTANGPGSYRVDRLEREVDPGSGDVTETWAQETWEVDADGWLLPHRRKRLVLGDGTFSLDDPPLTEPERRDAWAALARERARDTDEWK